MGVRGWWGSRELGDWYHPPHPSTPYTPHGGVKKAVVKEDLDKCLSTNNIIEGQIKEVNTILYGLNRKIEEENTEYNKKEKKMLALINQLNIKNKELMERNHKIKQDYIFSKTDLEIAEKKTIKEADMYKEKLYTINIFF